MVKRNIREPKMIKATAYIINMECANGFHFKIFFEVLSARKIAATPFSCHRHSLNIHIQLNLPEK